MSGRSADPSPDVRRSSQSLNCTGVTSTRGYPSVPSARFRPPRPEAGRRTVAVPPHIVPELVGHLATNAAEDLDALVFTGEKGGPVRPHVLQQAWARARSATGLFHVHLHDSPHAVNTWAAATGASTKELMARMGHASSEAVLHYQHATADRDRVIAEALSAMAYVAEVGAHGEDCRTAPVRAVRAIRRAPPRGRCDRPHARARAIDAR